MMKFVARKGRQKQKLTSRVNVFACMLCALYSILNASLVYAADATLYLSPPAGIYTVNEHAMIRVFVSSDGAPVYGVEGVLVFDPLKMNVISVSNEASVLTSWPTPPSFSNEKGEIYFGGALSTSTVLDRGHIISLVITPLRDEDFQLAFKSGAAILAGDGTGGNIVSTLKSGNYTGIPTGEEITSLATPPPEEPSENTVASSTQSDIAEEEKNTETEASGVHMGGDGEVLGTSTEKEMISSPSHPDQHAWYRLATSTITWDMPAGVARVRLSLNKKPEGEGTVLYGAPTREKVLSNLPEGIQYLHLTREWSDGHTDGATYRIQTDITPPGSLTLTEKPRTDLADPSPVFLISATDTLSGVDHYELSVDDGIPTIWVPDEEGEYHTPALLPGLHEVVARAVDKAGNTTSTRLSLTVEHLPTPTITLVDKKFTEGKHFRGEIVSPSAATVTLFIKRAGETAQEEIILSEEGSAFFTSALILQSGAHEIWVVSHDARGATSKESEHITFPVTPSYLGIIKRHPLIPVVALLFMVFLFALRFFWQKLHSSDNYNGDEGNDAIPGSPHPRSNSEGTVVLTSVIRKPNNSTKISSRGS